MMTWVERWISPVLSPQFWKEEFQQRPYELLGFTSTVAVVAYGVKTVCGKRFAAGVVVVAFANYSSMREIVILHKEELVQVATNLIVPLFCLAMPQLIKVMLPVYVVWIGVTIVQQRKKAEGQTQQAVQDAQQQASEREKELQGLLDKTKVREQELQEQVKKLQDRLNEAVGRITKIKAQIAEQKKSKSATSCNKK